MSWYGSVVPDDIEGFTLVETLETLLFPNDGTLSFMQALITIVGSGLFAIRETLAQQVGVTLGNDEPLPSNVPVPPDWDYSLDEEGEP